MSRRNKKKIEYYNIDSISYLIYAKIAQFALNLLITSVRENAH